MHGLALLREKQREPAVVAEAVEQAAARVAGGGFPVFPLIEEKAGLLPVTDVHAVGRPGPPADFDGLRHVTRQHIHALLEAFERAHLRIVPRKDAARRQQFVQQ